VFGLGEAGADGGQDLAAEGVHDDEHAHKRSAAARPIGGLLHGVQEAHDHALQHAFEEAFFVAEIPVGQGRRLEAGGLGDALDAGAVSGR
jgi:hypothetical protein